MIWLALQAFKNCSHLEILNIYIDSAYIYLLFLFLSILPSFNCLTSPEKTFCGNFFYKNGVKRDFPGSPGSVGSILHWGTKILHSAWCGQNKHTHPQTKNTFKHYKESSWFYHEKEILQVVRGPLTAPSGFSQGICFICSLRPLFF